ncbi:hypothetical protein GCM10010909_13080 [Acidocella aquatica]|uniref:DUF1302 domain-containing protein n=2 Tax=Acidocella aquatica TaxID=1922313 RepID=A0ABQ6A5Q9_9PROT|nr:hypothetical protein GCM10010909_13080 [Acidocella aquatica]
MNLYDGSTVGNNLEINLDITASYSGQYRVQSPSKLLVSGATNANGNDGDANFRHGLVGNTFSVLPVLDIKDNSFGMHFSGEYFINTVYLGTNQNNQASTVNPVVAKNTDFAKETRIADGHNGRMLDAFVYDGWDFGGGQRITLKAGQQTLFWGQSLFYGVNGISGGQAPIDSIAAENLVNPQVQQIFLPVGQIVATYQPDETYTIQGYYQYQWEPYSLPGVGSYFSPSDVVGPGGYRIIIPLGPLGTAYLHNDKPLTPERQNGQFGLSLQATYDNYDLGLFGERFDAKTPEVSTVINLVPSHLPLGYPQTLPNGGSYREYYGRDIWLGGASASTTIGVTNVAAEASVRAHQPLVSTGTTVYTFNGLGSTYTGNANSDPGYSVGDTTTELLSAIYGSPALKYDPGGVTVIAEIEYVDVFHVTRHKDLLAPGRNAAASAFDIQVNPQYLNVLPSLNLAFPVSISYNYLGNSQMDGSMQHGTGSYSAGVSATYRQVWDATLSYVGYFGSINPGVTLNTSQMADRGYLSLNLQHTF